jgi:hypothetical protein
MVFIFLDDAFLHIFVAMTSYTSRKMKRENEAKERAKDILYEKDLSPLPIGRRRGHVPRPRGL